MSDSRRAGALEQDPGNDAAPRWSLPLPSGPIGLNLLPSGGCLATSGESGFALERDGSTRWRTPISNGPFGGNIIDIQDGLFARIEGDEIVSRALKTGQIHGSFPVRQASNLSLAPWGDLIYSANSTRGVPSIYCATPGGSVRWSIPINDSPPSGYAAFPLNDVIIIERRGMLWAYDHVGQSQWVVDEGGVREPRTVDEELRPWNRQDPQHGTELFDSPNPLDSDRVAVGLQSYSRTGWYLLDAAAAKITRLGGDNRPWQPFAVLPHSPTEFRIAWSAGKLTVGTLDWRYLLLSSEPDGRLLWEHRLPAEPMWLDAAPRGHLIATATASEKRWHDYGPYYHGLSDETFVRCIGSDGSARWTWHANGPITNPPVIDSDGTIYVGAEQKIWALSCW